MQRLSPEENKSATMTKTMSRYSYIYTVSLHADIATQDCAAVGGFARAPGAQEPLLPGLQGPRDLLLRG